MSTSISIASRGQKKTSLLARKDDFDTKLVRTANQNNRPSLGLYRDYEGKTVEVIAFNVTSYDTGMRATRTNVLVCKDRLTTDRSYFTIPITQFLAIMSNNKPRYTKIPNAE